jgi:hypothetical protein
VEEELVEQYGLKWEEVAAETHLKRVLQRLTERETTLVRTGAPTEVLADVHWPLSAALQHLQREAAAGAAQGWASPLC